MDREGRDGVQMEFRWSSDLMSDLKKRRWESGRGTDVEFQSLEMGSGGWAGCQGQIPGVRQKLDRSWSDLVHSVATIITLGCVRACPIL
jgi:hypothetical protein